VRSILPTLVNEWSAQPPPKAPLPKGGWLFAFGKKTGGFQTAQRFVVLRTVSLPPPGIALSVTATPCHLSQRERQATLRAIWNSRHSRGSSPTKIPRCRSNGGLAHLLVFRSRNLFCACWTSSFCSAGDSWRNICSSTFSWRVTSTRRDSSSATWRAGVSSRPSR